jgi:hypothetical protein
MLDARALAVQVFKSHCAPEPTTDLLPAQLTIVQLKEKLKALNQPQSGRKVSTDQSKRTHPSSSRLWKRSTAM